MNSLSSEHSGTLFSEEFRGHSAGIVTFMDGKNYGCDLQRYAMQTVLRKFGLRALLIDYAPPQGAGRPGLCRRALRALHPVSLAKASVSFLDRREAVFRGFKRRHLLTTEPIASYRDLPAKARFDCYVAGSDQIWNPNLCRGEEGSRFFMLDFAPPGTKISYAPSLGVSRVEPPYAGLLRERLASFEWVSVREKEGAEILRPLLGRPVDVVLDPAMLLTAAEWNTLADTAARFPVQKKKYIFCYSLGNAGAVLGAARRLRALYDAAVAVIAHSPLDALRLRKICPGCRPVLNAGPAEFVSLIRSAESVVTDSFHGTVFSILFRRPFRTMMRDRRGGSATMNSRTRTLLETFGLEERLFDPETFSGGAREEMDYDSVEQVLVLRREDSLKKLENGLRKVFGHGTADNRRNC